MARYRDSLTLADRARHRQMSYVNERRDERMLRSTGPAFKYGTSSCVTGR